MSKLVALIVKGEFHWGFSVRLPLATMSECYPVPPPTTLIGALARGLAEVGVLNKTEVCTLQERSSKRGAQALYSTVARIVNAVKVASFRYEKPEDSAPTPYSDPLRLLRVIYMRKEHAGRMERWFGFAKSGRVYAPAVKFEILYILDLDTLSEKCEVPVTIHDLVKACFSVPYIGCKESIVTIQQVKYTESVRTLRISGEFASPINTNFYVPLNAVKENTIIGDYVLLDMPYPRVDWYQIRPRDVVAVVSKSVKRFVVPCRQHGFIEPASIRFIPESGAVIYECTVDKETRQIVWC